MDAYPAAQARGVQKGENEGAGAAEGHKAGVFVASVDCFGIWDDPAIERTRCRAEKAAVRAELLRGAAHKQRNHARATQGVGHLLELGGDRVDAAVPRAGGGALPLQRAQQLVQNVPPNSKRRGCGP